MSEPQSQPMRRIAILGCGGSGKSTLARQLGDLLGLEVIHLDAHYWKPNWTPTPKEEWEKLHHQLCLGENWIMDGNFGAARSIRLERADTILFFDLPTRICLQRVVKRWWTYRHRTRPDMGEGCHEQIDWEFLHWILTFRRVRRPRILEALGELCSSKRVILLKNDQQVERFLDCVQRSLEPTDLLFRPSR